MSGSRIMWIMESPVKGFSIGQVVWFKPHYPDSISHRGKICKIELEDNEAYFLIRLFDSASFIWADSSELHPFKDGGILKKFFGGVA